jgi:hypothetical protein
VPDKPILIFPAATVAARQKAGGGLPKPIPRPPKSSQGQRLGARFQSLEPEFGSVQMTPNGVDPEQVIVLETIGSIADFQNVVKKITGMEWLGDFDAEVVAGDPGFLANGEDPGAVKARLFVLATNRSAYNEVLRLWKLWLQSQNDKLPRGFGRLAEAFAHLNDVRPWGYQDRVMSTGVVAYWEKALAANAPTIRFEAELWCRADSAKQSSAFDRLRNIVSGFNGQCISQVVLSEIDYHGVLVDLPAGIVRQAIDAINNGSDTQLLRLVDIKYFSPMGQAAIMPIDAGVPITRTESPFPNGEPVVAILDGLPMTNHAALQGRLQVDDPDNIAAQYQAGEHRHGTAMASLIVHGEYDSAEAPINSKVYVRPVMQPGIPDFNGRRFETLPSNELTVDLIHRAVRRMFESDGSTQAQATKVKVINLSLGDKSQPFDRNISPWARLLDWLSWKYKVLFVVSAGNHLDDITIPAPPSALAGMKDHDLQASVLRDMAHQRVQRRLLAPAESINALTVGALHSQGTPSSNTGTMVDLLRGAALPSPLSSVASGFRRAIKPEILVPGGRLHYAPKLHPGISADATFEIGKAAGQPGQLVAACHPTGATTDYAVHTNGTSNAAALTTHRAAQLIEHIAQLRRESGGESLTDARMAVILKAMLVHGASWGEWYEFFDQTFDGPDTGPERWWRMKRACSQFLGYGSVDFERGTICNDQRVIVLGCGELSNDEGHIYNVPLPPALNALTVLRRLTVTLAWFTPINPRHRNYREADLWVDPPLTHLNVKRRNADHDAVTRGTIQHEILEGNGAVPITAGDLMPFQVNCRAEATTRLKLPISYSLLVSIEIAQPLAVSIYEQVKVALDALRAPVLVQPVVST